MFDVAIILKGFHTFQFPSYALDFLSSRLLLIIRVI